MHIVPSHLEIIRNNTAKNTAHNTEKDHEIMLLTVLFGHCKILLRILLCSILGSIFSSILQYVNRKIINIKRQYFEQYFVVFCSILQYLAKKRKKLKN